MLNRAEYNQAIDRTAVDQLQQQNNGAADSTILSLGSLVGRSLPHTRQVRHTPAGRHQSEWKFETLEFVKDCCAGIYVPQFDNQVTPRSTRVHPRPAS